MEQTGVKRKRLGELLISAGLINEEQLRKALELQKQTGRKLGEVFVKEGFVTQEMVVKVLETQLGIRSLDLSRIYIEPEAVKMVPENMCRKHTVLGIQISNGRLLLAMKDPLDYFAIDDVKLMVNIPIIQAIASESDILHAIERMFSKNVAEKAARDFVRQFNVEAPKPLQLADDGTDEVSSSPIVIFINSIIENAVRNNASDIHIEPTETDVRVRLRIDGILHESVRTGLETLNATITRIKIMSNLNIAEKRIPQDGRIGFSIDGRDIDLRISTLPTTYGEKIAIRILDRTNFVLSKEKLGLSADDIVKFDRLISKPYGVILVTGPTGSGKTSSLYAMLSELNTPEKNIVTLEDPVEYNLRGINQVRLNAKAGLTFATGLRSILRQDPDIIMVGEMRDNETAEIAIRSAMTGHLVLSTLHTNDASGAIARIVDMGIEPFLISSSILGVLAQRLVRKICPLCMIQYEPDEREQKILGFNGGHTVALKKGTGCKVCNGTGYKGRTAIFEIMEVDKNLRNLIDKGATTDEIREAAISGGMSTLWDSCKRLVLKGVTTVEEMVRVTYGY